MNSLDKKQEIENILRGVEEDDLGDLDMNLDVDAILNEIEEENGISLKEKKPFQNENNKMVSQIENDKILIKSNLSNEEKEKPNLKSEIKQNEFDKMMNDLEDSEDMPYNQALVNDILKGIEEMGDHESPLKIKKDKSSFEDPLDRIDKEEKEISKNDDYKDLESKFVLSNNMASLNLKKFNNINYEPLTAISQKLYPYYGEGSSKIGIPRCITVSGEKCIIVGTSYSFVCIFDYNQKEMRVFGTTKEQNYGAVSALDASRDGEALISGYEKGQIVLWDLNTGANLKTIVGVSECPLLSIRFYKETKSHIVCSDNAGNVFLLNVNKVFFSFTVDKQLLLHKSAGNVCCIDVLRSQNNFYMAHMIKNYILIAICSLNVVLLISLEPMVRILYKFERPDYIKEGSVPCVSWGKGVLKDENLDLKNPILAISWGNIIHLIPVPNNDLYETKDNFILKSYYVSDSEIIYMSWIAPNLILYVDSRKRIKIVFSGYFEKGKYNEKSFEKTYDAIMNDQQMDSELAFQTYLEDSSKRTRSCFQNTIFMNENLNCAFFLGSKKLVIGKLAKWISFIYAQIEKGDWMNTLYFCLELYKGNTKMFSDIPLDENDKKTRMKMIFNDIIKRYVEDLGKLTDETTIKEEIWETYILTTIDFLVFIENYQYLFTTIKGIFAKYNYNQTFLKCLEPFILKNKIKFIPNDPFREIVTYYKDLGKSKVLQHLIVNLDIKSMDPGYIISLCLEYNLYTALIYICTRSSDNDFITPLVKMFAVYREKTEKNLHEEAQKNGYKCLWYIKITLNGELFPDDKIPDDVYNVVVRQMVVWIFVEENIKALIEFDPQITFNILLILFQGNAAAVLQENNEDLINYFKGRNKRKKSIEEQEIINEKYVHKNILDIIFNCCPKENKKIRPFFINFVAKIVTYGKFKLDYDLCIECAIFLIEKPHELKNLEKKNTEDIYDENFIEEKNQLILNLLKVWESELLPKDLNLLFEATELSPFIEVLCYLHNLKKNYKKCFDLYIESKFKNVKKKIFNWLEETLKKLEFLNKEQFNILLDYILERLKDLVLLNSERTQEIITKYNKNSEKKAIFQLAPWPQLQLDLLSKLLEERKNGAKIDNDLLILHISLLCNNGKGNKEELLKELQSYDYPLDECLKLCKECKMDEATAFLLERSGAVMEAIILYFEIFKELVTKAIRKIEKGKYYDYQKFHSIIKLAINVCKKNNKAKDIESEKLWFFLLDKLLDLHNENFSNKTNNSKYEKLFEAYSEIISNTFEEIIRNVSLMSLVNQIDSKYGLLDLRNLKKSFMSMLSNYSYEENILKNSKKLIVNDITDNGISIFSENTRGLSLKPLCEECKTQFNENSSEKLFIYFCCHSFHKRCVNDQKCSVCAKEENYQLTNLILSIKNKLPTLQQKKKENNLERESFKEEIKDNNNNMSQILNLEQMKLEVRDKMLRKLKVFDFRKEDERIHFDLFRAKYEI